MDRPLPSSIPGFAPDSIWTSSNHNNTSSQTPSTTTSVTSISAASNLPLVVSNGHPSSATATSSVVWTANEVASSLSSPISTAIGRQSTPTPNAPQVTDGGATTPRTSTDKALVGLVAALALIVVVGLSICIWNSRRRRLLARKAERSIAIGKPELDSSALWWKRLSCKEMDVRISTRELSATPQRPATLNSVPRELGARSFRSGTSSWAKI